MNYRLVFELTQSLDTVHDALVGIFVDGHSNKLGLSDTNNRCHDQHRLNHSPHETLR